MHTFGVEELWQLAAKDPACAALLCPTAFETGRRTPAIASALRQRNCVLNTSIAGAMGRVAQVFGMTKLSKPHVIEFVARIVDGFSVQRMLAADIQTMSALASCFALGLGSHRTYTHQEIMGAFLEGIDEGTKCAAHWSRSSSGRKRTKRR